MTTTRKSKLKTFDVTYSVTRTEVYRITTYGPRAAEAIAFGCGEQLTNVGETTDVTELSVRAVK
ncbi:MAG TPA: hypothetical protein VNZ53_50035, partial [Steroidobacteraceae bacterium]|nr:hypothetical protein [Steroidobacteraceae bacterium]